MLKERFEKGTSAGIEQYIITIPTELEEASAVRAIGNFLSDNCPAHEGATAEVQALVDGKVGNFAFQYADDAWTNIPPVGFSVGGGGGDSVTITITHVPPEGQEMVNAYAQYGMMVNEVEYSTPEDQEFSDSAVIVSEGYFVPTWANVTEGSVMVGEGGLEVVSGDAEISEFNHYPAILAHGDCAVRITWQWQD